MSLTSGARLGPYQLGPSIGAGGMGEVYRARDSRLGRDVAIKILPTEVADDPDRLRRFEQEARAAASLNHPNILSVHDVGTDNGVAYLVTELLEGRTLRDEMCQNDLRGRFPSTVTKTTSEVVLLAVQIADGLAAAHARGIVHRDLKPENVFVTSDGRVKILDFGLAKVIDLLPNGGRGFSPGGHAGSEDPASETALSPTPTASGVILGTVGYMAPEQIRGQAVDARTDIFAFGCVLYEMLAGRRAFTGNTAVDTLSAILTATPAPLVGPSPASAIPFQLVRIAGRCLEKAPTARFQTALDLAFALKSLDPKGEDEDRVGAPLATAQSVRSRRRDRTASIVLGIAAGALVMAVAWWTFGPGDPSPSIPMHLQLSLAPADAIIGSDPTEIRIGSRRPSRTDIALSPDGRWLVFAGERAGVQQLYLRELASDQAKPIAGTEDSDNPFFSPNGKWVGFSSKGSLRKVSIEGGPIGEICKCRGTFGATWGPDDVILFSSGILQKVPASGGTPAAVTTVNRDAGETIHAHPSLVPNGQSVIFTVVSGRPATDSQVVIQSLATGERRVLMENATDGRFAASGHLVFMRLGTLMAAPFDLSRLEVAGPEVGLVDNVMVALNAPNQTIDTGAGQFAWSSAGHLVYLAGGTFADTDNRLVWMDRQGGITPIDVAPRAYLAPRLSPDGQKIAIWINGLERSIWVYDLRRGSISKLRFNGSAQYPIWTPDGKRIVFAGEAKGRTNLYWMAADDSAAAERLTTSTLSQLPAGWSGDGELIFLESGRGTQHGIYAMSMTDRHTRPLVDTPVSEEYPAVSPDGRWLAYVSTVSGPGTVFVQPYSGPGDRVPISTAPGAAPRWTHAGRELIYTEPVGLVAVRIMSVTVTTKPRFSASLPRLLVEVPTSSFGTSSPLASFDIAADGRLLGAAVMVRTPPPPTTLTVILNWFDELRAKAPGK